MEYVRVALEWTFLALGVGFAIFGPIIISVKNRKRRVPLEQSRHVRAASLGYVASSELAALAYVLAYLGVHQSSLSSLWISLAVLTSLMSYVTVAVARRWDTRFRTEDRV